MNDKLTDELQKQTNSSRNQIELLNNEIHQLEKTLNELKEEKYQLIQIKRQIPVQMTCKKKEEETQKSAFKLYMCVYYNKVMI